MVVVEAFVVVALSVVVVEPVVEIVEPQPAPEPVVVDKDPDVEEMTDGASYVVWGVFSQKSNAMRYKSMITRKYGDVVTPTIYHHRDDTMYLLALAEKSSRNQCIAVVEQLQELDGLFDELWIFTNK